MEERQQENNNNRNYFSTNENKAMLWKLLENGRFYNDIPGEYFSNIRSEFENKIRELSSTRFREGYSLIELNKTFITEMIEQLEKFKKSIKPAPQDSLKNAFDKKKEDFNSLMENKAPTKVDFSDKIDEAIGESKIESILAETIARRERELNFVLDKQGKIATNDNNKKTINDVNSIKIGDVLQKEKVLNVKQVRFSEKVEMREHFNLEDNKDNNDNESANAAATVITEVATELASIKNKDLNSSPPDFLQKMEYDYLLEKIDGILTRSKKDVLNAVSEWLLSSRNV